MSDFLQLPAKTYFFYGKKGKRNSITNWNTFVASNKYSLATEIDLFHLKLFLSLSEEYIVIEFDFEKL